MYRTNHKRLSCLEAALLEAQISQIDKYYDTITEADLELICTITEELQAGAISREYSPAEVEFYNRHVDVINGFPGAALVERAQRQARGLVATGAATQAEIDEIFKTQEDHDSKKL